MDISLAPVSQAGLDTSSRQEVSFSGSKGARFYVGVAKETGEPSGVIRCDFRNLSLISMSLVWSPAIRIGLGPRVPCHVS